MYATRESFTPSTAHRPRYRSRNTHRPRSRAASLQTSRLSARSAAPTPRRARASRPTRLPQRPFISPVSPSGARVRPRVNRRGNRQATQQRVNDLTRETVIKLSINTFLLGLSATALTKLVPSHLTQQVQLREIRTELAFTQKRVDNLRADFSRTFDPMQAYSVMQQQSHLIDPNQRPVVFTPRNLTTEQLQP